MDTVVFRNPITNKPQAMPVQMVNAYVPYASDLELEEAAKVAAIRDDEAATNFLLSVIEAQEPGLLRTFEALASLNYPEGASIDLLAVEPPSLR